MQCPVVEKRSHSIPHFLTAFGMGLHQSEVTAGPRALAHGQVETEKFETCLPGIQQTRFRFVELQTSGREPSLEPLEQFGTSPFRAEDHEIVSVAHHGSS